MPKNWTEAKIQNFIKSEIEESLTLEYTFRANFPLLRNMSMSWKIPLSNDFTGALGDLPKIKWKVYADNALPKEGRISIDEIEIVDLRKKTKA